MDVVPVAVASVEEGGEDAVVRRLRGSRYFFHLQFSLTPFPSLRGSSQLAANEETEIIQ